jgi:diaminopimelate decarboxylase
MGRDILLARAKVGDLVGIFQSGAYGLTASPILFLSHGVPAELLISDGTAEVVRERSGWEGQRR